MKSVTGRIKRCPFYPHKAKRKETQQTHKHKGGPPPVTGVTGCRGTVWAAYMSKYHRHEHFFPYMVTKTDKVIYTTTVGPTTINNQHNDTANVNFPSLMRNIHVQ